jgi:dGTP triphosphohydrolase
VVADLPERPVEDEAMETEESIEPEEEDTTESAESEEKTDEDIPAEDELSEENTETAVEAPADWIDRMDAILSENQEEQEEPAEDEPSLRELLENDDHYTPVDDTDGEVNAEELSDETASFLSQVQELIEHMFGYMCRNTDRLPPMYAAIREAEGTERAVCDFIASMSDKYAVDAYRTIFIPHGWQINTDKFN